jgi:hypothetical protein
MNSQTFERLASGQTRVDDAIRTGRVLIEGNGVPLELLPKVLAEVARQVPKEG